MAYMIIVSGIAVAMFYVILELSSLSISAVQASRTIFGRVSPKVARTAYSLL